MSPERSAGPRGESLELFPSDPGGASAANAPLAERMRPRRLEEVVGQEQLVAPGAALRVLIESGQLPSLILWGPPGSGKTTLARLLAETAGAHFEPLSAVMAGVKEIRGVIDRSTASTAPNRIRCSRTSSAAA
jgi:putative ATPase